LYACRFKLRVVKLQIIASISRRYLIMTKNPFFTKKLLLDNKFKNPDIPFLKLFYLSLFLAFTPPIIVMTLGKLLPPEVPVFYGLPDGEGQLGLKSFLAIPGIISLLIIGVNSVVLFLTTNPYLKKVLVVAGFVASMLSAITVIKIFFLVGTFLK
jgi:hypothetical protein